MSINEQSFLQNEEIGQRRYLTTNEEVVIDVGEENVWDSQLRARKTRQHELQARERPKFVGSNRQLAAAIEEDYDVLDMNGERPKRWMADLPIRYPDKHHFEECVGKTLAECQVLVDAFVQSNPEMFNNQTTLIFDIRKIRELTDESYFKVVLRTNMPGDKVYGVFDDAMVYYPWPWKMNGVDTPIGPWDCQQNGTVLTPRDCCRTIQKEVNKPDDYGNYLACFVEEPVGGPHNPERDDRAIVVSDATGVVVRAPVAH